MLNFGGVGCKFTANFPQSRNLRYTVGRNPIYIPKKHVVICQEKKQTSSISDVVCLPSIIFLGMLPDFLDGSHEMGV